MTASTMTGGRGYPHKGAPNGPAHQAQLQHISDVLSQRGGEALREDASAAPEWGSEDARSQVLTYAR
jgi:hypothetical protein